MNYNALLLLDKHHKYRNNFSINVSNINHLTSSQKNYRYINIHTKENKKNEKFYSVKPYLYMMPKDIILRDLFYSSIKSSRLYIKKYNLNNNTTNNGNLDREYIFKKIKKYIMINRINYSIFSKTIFLYDLLNFEIEKGSMKNKKLSKFCSLPNMSIALIALILTLKFNYIENKLISLKKILRNFEEINENIKLNEVCEMEIMALKLINYNLTFQTPFSFMELFLINGILFSEDYIHYDLSYKIYDLVNETLEKIMETSNDYFKYNYFYLSCSVIMYIREKFKVSRWPKALEVTFDVSFDQFYDIYYTFFIRNNKKDNNNKDNIKSSYNSDIINISNLKSMNNIISVLKIMRSADKYRRTKEKVNKLDIFNNKNDKEDNYKDNKNNNDNNNNNPNVNCPNKIKVGLKQKWNFSTFKSPKNFDIAKTTVSSSFIKSNEGNKNNINENEYNNSNKNNVNDIDNKNEEEKKLMNTNSGELIKKGSFIVLENSSINKAKSRKETLRSVSIFDNKEIENKASENENEEKYNESNGIEALNQIKSISINSNELTKKGSFRIIENSKINTTKSCNRYKKNIISKNQTENYNTNNNKDNCNIYHKCNTNSNLEPYYSNNTLNVNIYKKRNYMSKRNNDLLKSNPDVNKEIKNNNFNNNKINSFTILNKNNNYNYKTNNRYYNNCTEKRRNFDYNNNNNNLNKNQTSFNDCIFYKNYNKNKNNSKNKDNENYFDNFNIKNKEENSNAPTCENSNLKLSLNDLSIRQSYKKKLTNKDIPDISPKNETIKKYEKEGRKLLEKNKSYNKLMNNKILFSDNTYNRKIGVRKYYKHKNSREHHIISS